MSARDNPPCSTSRIRELPIHREPHRHHAHRTLKGEDFLWLLLQHVLPKGFRRVRDYGFLHGNAKKLLALVQWVLQVIVTTLELPRRPPFLCPHCQTPMAVLSLHPASPPQRAAWESG